MWCIFVLVKSYDSFRKCIEMYECIPKPLLASTFFLQMSLLSVPS